MPYPALEELVAPARPRCALWRLVLGLGLVLVVYIGWLLAVFAVLLAVSGGQGGHEWLARIVEGDGPITTLLILASFVGMGIGPLLAARLVHRRAMASLFGPRARLVRDFAVALGVCAVLYGLSALVPSAIVPDRNLSIGLWLSLLPLAVLGVLIQTGAEEILFRGYIMTQLAARFSARVVWMVLPSAAFALLHFEPGLYGGAAAWMVVGAVFLFALLAADLTAHTGSIGAAWGFHFANNLGAILFVGAKGPLAGLALYTVTLDRAGFRQLAPIVIVDMLVLVAVWATIRAVLGRYGRDDSGAPSK